MISGPVFIWWNRKMNQDVYIFWLGDAATSKSSLNTQVLILCVHILSANLSSFFHVPVGVFQTPVCASQNPLQVLFSASPGLLCQLVQADWWSLCVSRWVPHHCIPPFFNVQTSQLGSFLEDRGLARTKAYDFALPLLTEHWLARAFAGRTYFERTRHNGETLCPKIIGVHCCYQLMKLWLSTTKITNNVAVAKESHTQNLWRCLTIWF